MLGLFRRHIHEVIGRIKMVHTADPALHRIRHFGRGGLVVFHQDVPWLQVAVHEVVLVQPGHGIANLIDVTPGLIWRDMSAR